MQKQQKVIMNAIETWIESNNSAEIKISNIEPYHPGAGTGTYSIVGKISDPESPRTLKQLLPTPDSSLYFTRIVDPQPLADCYLHHSLVLSVQPVTPHTAARSLPYLQQLQGW